MGINLSFLPFFDLCFSLGVLVDPILALGNQKIWDEEKAIKEFAINNKYISLAKDVSVRSLFYDRYGLKEYKDCDINNQADIWQDIAAELDVSLFEWAGTIIDAGTLEHIFDLRQSYQNLFKIVKNGGYIIHISPISWFDHGFYNINPCLFNKLIKVNECTLCAEAYHFPVPILPNEKGPGPNLYITYSGLKYTDISYRIANVLSGSFMPANGLYMVAYRKEKSAQFKSPYDITY